METEKKPIEVLKKYLNDTGLTQAEFAKKCRITPCWFGKILKGQRITRHVADNIEIFTKGRIKYEDLIDEPRCAVSMRRIRGQKSREDF